MVRAPSPEMCGAVDCRLLDDDEGVYDLCAAGDRPGEGMELGSGVMETVRWPGCCLEGGCKDFAFALRAAVGSLGTPVGVVVLRLADNVSRLFPLFNEGARPSWGIVLSLASLSISWRSKLFVGSIPGPTLFRGARAAGFGGAWAGN
jgi:hypothetical protein